MEVRRPAQEPMPMPVPPVRSSSNTGSKVLIVVAAVVTLVVLGGAAMFLRSVMADSGINKNEYQAVFLTNGQVYFGKVKDLSDSYLRLSDIFYLQVQQQVQPKDQTSQQQPQVSLAKLGSELHGPEDIMYINRDQVLFWENLKDKDPGKVVQAIKDYKAKGNK